MVITKQEKKGGCLRNSKEVIKSACTYLLILLFCLPSTVDIITHEAVTGVAVAVIEIVTRHAALEGGTPKTTSGGATAAVGKAGAG